MVVCRFRSAQCLPLPPATNLSTGYGRAIGLKSDWTFVQEGLRRNNPKFHQFGLVAGFIAQVGFGLRRRMWVGKK